MKKYTAVHLSDIHFGQEIKGNLYIHKDVRDELLNDCKTVRKELGEADAILIIGDSVYSGERSHYQELGNWLDSLADIVGCDKTAVNVVPGNHDVNWNEISPDCDIVHERLRSANSNFVDDYLGKLDKKNEANNVLLPKIAAYREFAERYGCDFESIVKPIWEKKVPLDSTNTLRIVGFNGVQVSDKKDSIGNMIFGLQQYIIKREELHESLFMIHHPLKWFKNHGDAEKYFKRAKIIIFGHEHQFKIEKMESEDGSERIEIHSGATNPPEEGRDYEFRYNWIQFYTEEKDNKMFLNVLIYARVWDSNNTMFIPDKNRFNGEAKKVYSLECKNFKVPKAPPLTFSDNLESSPRDGSNNSNDNHMDTNDLSYARLRYFFWKYLDLSSRVKIIVKLELLPDIKNQFLPQIMEKIALENAKATGKLKTLWDCIMEEIPEDKKEPNPFI